MPVVNQIALLVLFFFLSVFLHRTFISGEIDYQLNKGAVKKRKKGQTFKEWLLYSRYKDVITKTSLFVYYFALLIYPSGVLACVLLYTFDVSHVGEFVVVYPILLLECGWEVIIWVLFWQKDPTPAYSRWITKKKGQKPKKKKRR